MTLSIHHGSCTDILPSFSPASVDLVVTDPPYVCRYRDRTNRTVANDNQAQWSAPAFQEIARVMRPDSFCISFYGWNHVEKFMLAWKRCGLKPVGHLVWPKHYSSKTGYLAAQHEQAFLLAKGNPPKPAAPIADVQTWKYTGNTLHPTQKAVEILSPLTLRSPDRETPCSTPLWDQARPASPPARPADISSASSWIRGTLRRPLVGSAW